jgi:uncharacterized damage-inducible protein DinB
VPSASLVSAVGRAAFRLQISASGLQIARARIREVTPGLVADEREAGRVATGRFMHRLEKKGGIVSRSPEEVSKLFAYNQWANARTLGAVSALTPEELTRNLGGSFPSVHATLAHIYAAEWIWLERWQGRSPRALPALAEVPDLETLQEKWRKVERDQASYVERVTSARLVEIVTYVNVAGKTWSYPLHELLVHLVNHSTYHRGQAVTMVRQLGKPVEATDYLLFLDSKG